MVKASQFKPVRFIVEVRAKYQGFDVRRGIRNGKNRREDEGVSLSNVLIPTTVGV